MGLDSLTICILAPRIPNNGIAGRMLVVDMKEVSCFAYLEGHSEGARSPQWVFRSGK